LGGFVGIFVLYPAAVGISITALDNDILFLETMMQLSLSPFQPQVCLSDTE
jgi:hypothetical protein